MKRLRIAQVGPVATALPPTGSGSVELITWLMTEGLVRRGHDVTLFATGDTRTSARLAARYPHGYWHDTSMWPWELYEMLNIAGAVERAREFDVIHFQAAYYPMSLGFVRLCPVPLIQTLHHSPSDEEVRLWSQYPEAPFVAISREQARLMAGLNVVGTVLHGIDTESFPFQETPGDYVLFLGRLHPKKHLDLLLPAFLAGARNRPSARNKGRLQHRRGAGVRAPPRSGRFLQRTRSGLLSMPRCEATAAPGASRRGEGERRGHGSVP